MAKTKRRGRIFLWLAIAAVAVVVLSPFLGRAVYPVATRRLLAGTRLRAMINVLPEYLFLDYREAVSEKPGHLTIKDLSIRGSDPNVQWIIRLEDADVEFELSALLHRTFKVTKLRGSGLSFYLRNKIKPELVKATDVSVLPPVSGFSDPPLRSPDDKFPPVDPKALLIEVASVAVEHFDDIWVDGYHFRGGARVDGSFVLKPAIHAQIGPAKLTIESGDVKIGKASDGITVLGDITATFDPFAPLEYQDARIFQVITAQVKLEGAFQKLQALAPLFQAYGTRLEGGTGKATIEAAIDHGITKGGISAAVRNAVVQLDTYKLQGNADIKVNIPNWNLVSGPIDVSGTRVTISETREFHSKDQRRWSGQFDIPSGKIDVTTTATVKAKTQDARPMLAVLGAPLPGWTKPLVGLKDFSGGARATLGPSVVRIQDLDATGGTFRIQGHYLREKGKTDGAFLVESGILSVGVELDGTKTTVRPLFAKQWYAKQGDGGASGAKAGAAGK